MAITSTTIDLEWTAATDNIAVTDYKVYKSDDGITYDSGTSVGNVLAHTYINLLPDTQYWFKITAFDAAGNESLFSEVQTASTLEASYLLDLYPGATAAYSLRKLKSSFSLACNVRRDNDDAETSIFLEDSGSITLSSTVTEGGTLGDWVGSNSAFVTSWFDQSGNNNNAVQSTESLQPYLVLNGNLREVNGKAAVYFALSSRWLMTSVVATVPQPISRIAVNDFATTDLGYMIDGASLRGVLGQATGGNVRINAGTNQEYTVSPYIINTQYLTYGIFNGASSQVYKNGTGLGVKNAGTNGFDGVTIGATPTAAAPIKGSIQEAIVWGEDMGSDRVAIETNINDFYSIYP